MSEFDNLYLCPKCEHTDSLHQDDMICDKCGFTQCFVAKHIPASDRRYWIDVEVNGKPWRKEKRVSNMVKQHLPEDKKIIKVFDKLASELFLFLSNNKDDIDSQLPEFTRDYKRTTGRRSKGWRSSKFNVKFGRATSRGILYEGAFNKILTGHEKFEPVLAPLVMLEDAELWSDWKSSDQYSVDDEYNATAISEEHEEELIYFEPDGWFLYEGQRIPIEFKTYGKGGLVKKNFIKGLTQSRKYASLSQTYHGKNLNHYSALIICCPEERKYASVLMDNRIEKILPI
jgi:hypothetical protein|tara:strand:+ start:1591 stop:2448 length:858 start_codon:yes stop_codon:yes gene_type:complete